MYAPKEDSLGSDNPKYTVTYLLSYFAYSMVAVDHVCYIDTVLK